MFQRLQKALSKGECIDTPVKECVNVGGFVSPGE